MTADAPSVVKRPRCPSGRPAGAKTAPAALAAPSVHDCVPLVGSSALCAVARWLCQPGRRRSGRNVDVDADGQATLRCLLCMATTSSRLEVHWASALLAAFGEEHVRRVAAEVGGLPHFHRVCRWEASVCTRTYRWGPDWSSGGAAADGSSGDVDVGRGGKTQWAQWQLPEVPPDGVRVSLRLLGLASARLCLGAGPAAVVQAQRLGPPMAEAPGEAPEPVAGGAGAAYCLQAFWDLAPHGERHREADRKELLAWSLALGTYSLQLASHSSKATLVVRPVFGASFLATGKAQAPSRASVV
ncbi:unnamed protein product [Prorocentrum cordatum]|uniref:Uncharacterized protein n=1 Tax=Prorocentrum cordatum TaxID=2364126 RepID=A0ABN9WJG8_9DINO|nr:unnamed protein product [Polarella glacialis]